MSNRCKHEYSCTACGKCTNVCRCEPTDLYPAEVLEEMSTGVDPFELFTVPTPKENRL
jgi:hypothetical protein